MARQTAHVGGGANFGEIVDAAYENGLQMGECTSYLPFLSVCLSVSGSDILNSQRWM